MTVWSGDFEWDAGKAASNLAKHSVSFEEATTVFADARALDERDSSDQERLVTIGFSIRGRLLVVVWTERGSRIRLISARRATTHEQSLYARGG